jgi:hypothetical protein
MLAAFGFTAASSRLDFTPAEQRMTDYLEARHAASTPEEIAEFKENRKAIEDGTASPQATMKAEKELATPFNTKMFKKLTYEEALDVYHNYASAEEKDMMEPILAMKRARALRNDPEKVEKIEEAVGVE